MRCNWGHGGRKFQRIWSLLQGSFAKETYDLISHEQVVLCAATEVMAGKTHVMASVVRID